LARLAGLFRKSRRADAAGEADRLAELRPSSHPVAARAVANT
jgi:hypothetical protein